MPNRNGHRLINLGASAAVCMAVPVALPWSLIATGCATVVSSWPDTLEFRKQRKASYTRWHRRWTHAPVIGLVIAYLFGSVPVLIGEQSLGTAIMAGVAGGYLLHILADACTSRMGCPLLWPLVQRRLYVHPVFPLLASAGLAYGLLA